MAAPVPAWPLAAPTAAPRAAPPNAPMARPMPAPLAASAPGLWPVCCSAQVRQSLVSCACCCGGWTCDGKVYTPDVGAVDDDAHPESAPAKAKAVIPETMRCAVLMADPPCRALCLPGRGL